MSPDAQLAAFLDELRDEFPRFRIIRKADDPLSKAIDRALRVLTLGGQSRYLSHYHTVLGDRLYVPSAWDETPSLHKVVTLRHERVHLRQRRRYTFLGMAALYLLLPFPIGFAYGRARLEWEAYRETLAATGELLGEEALVSAALREHVVGQFLGPAYAWMWPFRGQVERWYDEALAELLPSERPA